MDKTKLAKDHLANACRLLEGNALSDVRFKIISTIREIEKLENKREKRAAIQTSVLDQWEEKMKAAVMGAQSPKESLNQIEKMIENEKKKLTQNETKPQTLTD